MRRVANAARFLAGLSTLAAAYGLAAGSALRFPAAAAVVAAGFYGLGALIDHTNPRTNDTRDKDTP